MKIAKRMLILPLMGILLLAGSSCKAQKQTSEQPTELNKNSGEQKAASTGKAEKSDPSSSALPPALDFTLESIRNQKVSLTDFLGNKIILINFWATWCPYCIAEIPHLNKIETSLADQVKFLSIDIGEKAEKVQKVVEQKKVLFDVLLDQRGEVARRYGVRGTPTNIVIDKKGDIVYSGHELDKAERVIMSLLSK